MSSLGGKIKAASAFAFKDLPFCLDGRLNQQRDDLLFAVVNAQRTLENTNQGSGDNRLGRNELTAAKKALDSIEERMREKSIVIRITAVNNGVWQKGIIQHPPRKGNQIDVQLGFNTDTFFTDMLMDTGTLVIEPGTKEKDFEDAVTEEIEKSEWAELFETWTAGDFDRIQVALINLNQNDAKRGVDFLGRGSGATTNSETTSEAPEA